MRRVDLTGVLLEGPEVRVAAAVFRIFARQAERGEGGVPPIVLALRDQLAAFAAFAGEGTQNPLTSDGGDGRFEGESGSADIALAVPGSPQITVRDAAAILALSDQAVRALCRSRALASVKTRAGWEIDADSAAGLAASRTEGTRWHHGTSSANASASRRTGGHSPAS